MFYIKQLLTLVICTIGMQLWAQNDFESLGETSLVLNHKLNSNYKMNFALRSRYYLYQEENLSFKNRQLDLVHFSSFNLSYNHSISIGIQYRHRASIDGGSNELRLTQQFNYTKKNQALRFGHRLRLEQRILDDLTILRSRYRFALDFPLNGEKLDIGETYFITSMEALISKNKKIKPELDHRTTTQIGWLLSQSIKIQIGIEYRFEAIKIQTQESFFILTSFVLKV